MSLSNSFFFIYVYVAEKEKNCIFHWVYFFFHYLKFSFKRSVNMRNKNVVVKHIFLKVPDRENNCTFHRVFSLFITCKSASRIL